MNPSSCTALEHHMVWRRMTHACERSVDVSKYGVSVKSGRAFWLTYLPASRRCNLLACPKTRQISPNRKRYRDLGRKTSSTKLPSHLIPSQHCQRVYEVLADIRGITHYAPHLIAAMPYPFPRQALRPQTPQPVQDIESPRNKVSRRPQTSWTGSKRPAIIATFLFAILLLLVYSLSSPSLRQVDRIPFSPDHVEEYAGALKAVGGS